MASSSGTRISLVWNKIIKELLVNRCVILSKDDITYGVDNIYRYFGTASPENVYKNMVYMNQHSKIGKFALTYNQSLVKYVKERKDALLLSLLSEAKSPEYDDNKGLSAVEVEDLTKQLNIEMSAIGELIYHLTTSETDLPDKIISSSDHSKCLNEVCLWSYPTAFTDRNMFHVKGTSEGMIWVSDSIDEKIQHAWCFKLVDLITIIVSGSNNPYTGKPFSETMLNLLKKRFRVECILVQRYLEVKS